MIPAIYTHAGAALLAGAIAFTGAWRVQDWRWDAADAHRLKQEQAAQAARDADAAQQRLLADQSAAQHAAALATINNQLGDARAHIARLSSRQCLSAGTVRMLNNVGAPSGVGLRAPAGEPESAPAAATAPGVDDAPGYASERDVAEHVALCRARYAEVAGQLNQILDIEDARQLGNTLAK